jgi:pilus assembly protein Flp/PilA
MLSYWTTWIRTHIASEKGQGMVEYGLIIALIAVVAAVTLSTLGTNIQTMFTNVADKIR